MIAHLRGKLIHKQPGQAIVEAAGVGYDVVISVPTFTALPSVGAEAALHIHTQVSEDQIALFGFLVTFMMARVFVFLIMAKAMPNLYFFMNGTSSDSGMRRWPPGVTRALSFPLLTQLMTVV